MSGRKRKQQASSANSIAMYTSKRQPRQGLLWSNIDKKLPLNGRVINLIEEAFTTAPNSVEDNHLGQINHTYITPIVEVTNISNAVPDSNYPKSFSPAPITYSGNGTGLKIQFSITPHPDFKASEAGIMIHISEHGYGYKKGEIITVKQSVFKSIPGPDPLEQTLSTLKISSVF
jgi:hypothetical protein